MKKSTFPINRTQSDQRIDKQVALTERGSVEGAESNIIRLIDMRRKVETELSSLNNDFDKYCTIYINKMEELKSIHMKMSSTSWKKN